jgi:hypothetical protein
LLLRGPRKKSRVTKSSTVANNSKPAGGSIEKGHSLKRKRAYCKGFVYWWGWDEMGGGEGGHHMSKSVWDRMKVKMETERDTEERLWGMYKEDSEVTEGREEQNEEQEG